MISLAAARPLSRLLGALALVAGLIASGPQGASVSFAQDFGPNPRDIATSDEEAGKEASLVLDEEGADDRARWVHRRWERNRDNEDVSVGPIITHNTVWVAKDVATAQAIFKEQESKQRDFPESVDRHEGPLTWDSKYEVGDEVSTLKACLRDRCESRGGIDLHQRVVVRKGNVVIMLYLFGRERNTNEDLAKWFVTKLLERM